MDIGELISQESHVICAHNYVCTFDFILCIWSRPHDKDCLYILLSSKNLLSHILTYRDSTLSLFILTSRNSLTLPVSKTQLNTCNMSAYTFCDLFLSYSAFQLDLFQPRTQPQKCGQTPKETNNQHGRRHVPPRIHCYISVY